MKLVGKFGIMSATVLCLTLGATAPAFAQQEHEQKEDQKETARPEEKKAQPERTARPAKRTAEPQEKKEAPKAAQSREKTTRRETTTKTTTTKREAASRTQRPQSAQRATARRIPADRYRAHFGREHTFHVSERDFSQNHRFQYGGYWFGVQDPWPSNWLYTQDVFVVEINGVYYLCNAAYPGVNLALNITM